MNPNVKCVYVLVGNNAKVHIKIEGPRGYTSIALQEFEKVMDPLQSVCKKNIDFSSPQYGGYWIFNI